MKTFHQKTTHSRLRSAVAAAAAGTALLAAGGNAAAEPVSLTLDFECPIPIIGDQVITSNISADIPAEQPIGDTPEFEINTINVLPATVRDGLRFGQVHTIEGTATATSVVEFVNRDHSLDVDLIIPQTVIEEGEGPFELPADGTAPPVTVTEDDVGTAVIRVDDLFLDITNRQEDGSLAFGDVGEFTSDCTLLPDQDTVLHTFEVQPPEGEDPKISVNPESIDFGTVEAGLTAEDSIDVSNVGGNTLGINNVTLEGTDADAFMITNDCTTLASGESCAVDVTYFPEGEEVQTATVVIESGDPETPRKEVPLSGEPVPVIQPEITVDPAELDFGVVEAGLTVEESVTISNTGGQELVIEGHSIEGPNASDFFVSDDNCAAPLEEDQSCSLTVTYTSVDQNREASLVIQSNAGDKTVPITAQESSETGFAELTHLIDGETRIEASGGTLPLSGSIDSRLELATGMFTADLYLDPTEGSFPVSDFFLFRGLKATAQVEFEPVEKTTGAIVGDELNATSVVNVKVTNVDLGLFGFNFSIGGGEECMTREPVVIDLASPEGEVFKPLEGGNLEGVYDLPALENCGKYTDLLNDFMAGPGNTINLTLTAE